MTTLPRSWPLTWRDLEALPDDGHRYEPIDGALVVTPAPSLRHQQVAFRLARLLDDGRLDQFLVLMAPFAVLLVEVLSPSTRLIDLNLKRARYEAAGCPSFWTVDPDALELTVWELADGTYHVAQVSGESAFVATIPFPLTVVPGRLLN